MDDLISRQAVDTLVDELARAISDERCCISRGRSTATIMQDILDLPSVKQEPCEDTISRQNDILPNIDKKVESYKKVIKNPVVKSIMGMDEEQEQIDFVQPHKKIPVTLTVQKEKTCDGCLFQQYPRITVCQECSRYYSDNYVKE